MPSRACPPNVGKMRTVTDPVLSDPLQAVAKSGCRGEWHESGSSLHGAKKVPFSELYTVFAQQCVRHRHVKEEIW
jgi:hypothetical protein